jgi:predicted nucleic acid-binding protein
LNVPEKIEVTNMDFNNEARFVEFFRQFPILFKKIRDIYLGSIISCYLEYETVKTSVDIEVIFDTNFILSLLDLNSEEAHKTCKTLFDILKTQGVKLRVMEITISECQHLLERKAEYFDKVFMLKKINPEDVYNACDRRNLNRTDLELIASKIEEELNKLGVITIPNTTKYQNIAKFSSEYESLRKIRNNDFAALHDATAIHYVRDKRGKPIKDFDKVNCWFLNNSSNLNFFHSIKNKGNLPEAIKAEDLLNILWLSNPNILTSLNSQDLIDIGITRLISCTLNDSLPRAAVLREFEEHIQKYSPMELTDKDILRVAQRVANKTLVNIEELNTLAENNQKAFVERLKKEAAKEKALEESTNKKIHEFILKLNQKQTQLEKLTAQADEKLKALKKQTDNLNKEQERVSSKERTGDELVRTATDKYNEEKAKRIKLENEIRKPKRVKHIYRKIFWWRAKTFSYILICLAIFVALIIYAYHLGDWKNDGATKVIADYKGNLIFAAIAWLASGFFSGFFIKRYSDQFGASNVNAHKQNIEKDLPHELKDVIE